MTYSSFVWSARHSVVCLLLGGAALGCGSTEASGGTGSSSTASGAGGAATSSNSSSDSAGGAGGATSSSGAGGTDACAAKHASFQQILDDSLAQAKAPGAVLAIVTPDCGKWVGATGKSTKAEPMKPDDVLRIGSVTKTFVATTVLELVGEGKLALDDSLEKWLPGFPGGASMTIRQVMNHTAGIFNYTDDVVFQMTENGDTMKKWTPQELIDIAAKNPPYFAPGMGWKYSNTDYILLGMLVEKISGATVGHEIRSRLLDPLMLTSTSFDGEEAVIGLLAHGFSKTGADFSTAFDPSYAWSAGAMVASAGDLADWAKALYGGTVLTPALLKEMETTVATLEQPGVSYGLGVFEFAASVAGDTAYGHMGDIPGYHTQMFYFPKEKITVVDIVNSDKGSPNPISLAVITSLLNL